MIAWAICPAMKMITPPHSNLAQYPQLTLMDWHNAKMAEVHFNDGPA